MHRADPGSLSQGRDEAVINLNPEIDDLVPSEAALHSVGDRAGASSFPKVLRRRLDDFFSEGNISPKANRTMWVKIAVGLAVLAVSWIALYALKPDSWRFVGLYLLNAVAQTFLLLNIAHDSNHNAISSVRSVNKALNYVFDVCGISSYMWRILHQSPRRRRRAYGTQHLTLHAPRTPVAGAALPAHLCALAVRAIFSRLCVSEGL